MSSTVYFWLCTLKYYTCVVLVTTWSKSMDKMKSTSHFVASNVKWNFNKLHVAAIFGSILFQPCLFDCILWWLAFVVLCLVSSVPSQKIDREESLRSDLLCTKWNAKPELNQSHSTSAPWAVQWCLYVVCDQSRWRRCTSPLFRREVSTRRSSTAASWRWLSCVTTASPASLSSTARVNLRRSKSSSTTSMEQRQRQVNVLPVLDRHRHRVFNMKGYRMLLLR